MDESIFSQIQIEDIDQMAGKYLTFWTEKQLYSMPISQVVQIIGVPTITTVAQFPDFAKGIIHFRGSVIPVIDMRLRMGKEEIPYDSHTCIIVTNIIESMVGFIVDSVYGVADIENEEISPPPKLADDFGNSYLTGVAKHEEHVILMLDTSKIMELSSL